eukprot:478234-Karenia_brevis.AAC.1
MALRLENAELQRGKQWVVLGLLSLPLSNDRLLPSQCSVSSQWQTAPPPCIACVDSSLLAMFPLPVLSCVDFGCKTRR